MSRGLGDVYKRQVIGNYAPTAKAVVTVTDANGKPVSGAKVDFKVYNYAEFYTVATKYTGTDGRASLTAGKGDMLVWASAGGAFGFSKLSFGKEDTLNLVLDKKGGEAYTLDLDITPPVEGANLPEVTPEQRAENDLRLAKEDSIRNAYVATMLTEERAKTALASFQQEGIADTEQFVKMLVASRGNYQTLLDFRKSATECDREGLALPLLQQLSAKDWRDVSLEVLEDHLKNAPDPQETDLWACAEIANPRVENEMLTPYRSFFKKVISKEEAGEFIKEPIRLVEWCKKEIQINNELNSQRIPMSPIGVWKARVADEKSRDIFFVAMARTLGIPARIDKVTGKVQYTDKEGHTFDVNFSTSSPVQATTGILRATYKPIASLPDPKYYSHFTLSKFKDGVFQLLNYDEGDVDMGKGATWANLLKNGAKLDSGYYMLVTGSRMASGAVLSNITFFNVKPEATTDIESVSYTHLTLPTT